jgi:hypothetical protein
MARGGVGVGPELITPEGGGGIQQIARPEHAPNYAALFSDVIRAAMEPSKFSWDMYYQGGELANKMQELGLRGQELDETKRSNLAKEQQMALEMALRNREAAETERFHRSTEQYQQGLLGNESNRIAEEKRHNQTQETAASDRLKFDTAKEQNEDLLRKAQEAEIGVRNQETQTELKIKQNELDDRANDDAVIAKLDKELHKYGPRDIYNSDTNPELQELMQWANSAVKTAYGHDRVTHMIGKESTLGQQVERQHAYTEFTPVGKDAFIKRFNSNQGPEADETYQQKWDAAFTYGKHMNDNELKRRDMSGAARLAYDQAIKLGKSEEDAMGAARTAEEIFKNSAKVKPITWSVEAIMKAIQPTDAGGGGQLVRIDGESDSDLAVRQSRLMRRMQDASAAGSNAQDELDNENQRVAKLNAAGGTKAPEAAKKEFEGAAAQLKPGATAAAAGATQEQRLGPKPPVTLTTPGQPASQAIKDWMSGKTATTETPPQQAVSPAIAEWMAGARGERAAQQWPGDIARSTGQTPTPGSPWSWLYRNLTGSTLPTGTPTFFKPTEESGSPTPEWAQTGAPPPWGVITNPQKVEMP